MIKILDQLLTDDPKGKGTVRNLNRTGQLALCGLIWWTVKEIPKQIEASACRCTGNPPARHYSADGVTNGEVIHARESE